MKKVIRLTESELIRIVKKVISEQSTPAANLPWINKDGKFKPGFQVSTKEDIIKINKQYLGLPVDTTITPTYLEEIKKKLKDSGISQEKLEEIEMEKEIILGFIPVFETYLDIKNLIDGITEGDKEKINSSLLGMVLPFTGKAMVQLNDYLNIKVLGKEEGQKLNDARKDVVNMPQSDREKLFKKYGYGYYSKWVADGKPKL
jgi:hypothetical protein